MLKAGLMRNSSAPERRNRKSTGKKKDCQVVSYPNSLMAIERAIRMGAFRIKLWKRYARKEGGRRRKRGRTAVPGMKRIRVTAQKILKAARRVELADISGEANP